MHRIHDATPVLNTSDRDEPAANDAPGVHDAPWPLMAPRLTTPRRRSARRRRGSIELTWNLASRPTKCSGPIPTIGNPALQGGFIRVRLLRFLVGTLGSNVDFQDAMALLEIDF